MTFILTGSHRNFRDFIYSYETKWSLRDKCTFVDHANKLKGTREGTLLLWGPYWDHPYTPDILTVAQELNFAIINLNETER